MEASRSKKKTGDVHDALFSLPRWDDARSNDADGRREDFNLGINMRKFLKMEKLCDTISAELEDCWQDAA